MWRALPFQAAAPPLRIKLEQALMVVEEAFDTCPPETSLVAWSAGKDSTLVLALVLEACHRRGLPPPCTLDIDQGDQFEELTDFRDSTARQWGVKLLIARNDDALRHVSAHGDPIEIARLDAENRGAVEEIGFAGSAIPWIPDSPVCNHLLKTVPIRQALAQHEIAMLFTGVRWDEHGAREAETYFSRRELLPHTRVHPILHFTERDVWDATFALEIPYCALYTRGYRSLGTKTGTAKTSDIPAWEQDLEHTAERGGRSREKEDMMAQLRAWGYL